MTSKTLRKPVRQNSVQICTASTFTDSQAHFVSINHQTKIVSIFKRSHRIGVQIKRLAKEPPGGHLRPRKSTELSYSWKLAARKRYVHFCKTNKYKKDEMLRLVRDFMPYHLLSLQPQIAVTLQFLLM